MPLECKERGINFERFEAKVRLSAQCKEKECGWTGVGELMLKLFKVYDPRGNAVYYSELDEYEGIDLALRCEEHHAKLGHGRGRHNTFTLMNEDKKVGDAAVNLACAQVALNEAFVKRTIED